MHFLIISMRSSNNYLELNQIIEGIKSQIYKAVKDCADLFNNYLNLLLYYNSSLTSSCLLLNNEMGKS